MIFCLISMRKSGNKGKIHFKLYPIHSQFTVIMIRFTSPFTRISTALFYRNRWSPTHFALSMSMPIPPRRNGMFIVFTSLCINRVNGAFSGQPAVNQPAISALARETVPRILAIGTGVWQVQDGSAGVPCRIALSLLCCYGRIFLRKVKYARALPPCPAARRRASGPGEIAPGSYFRLAPAFVPQGLSAKPVPPAPKASGLVSIVHKKTPPVLPLRNAGGVLAPGSIRVRRSSPQDKLRRRFRMAWQIR